MLPWGTVTGCPFFLESRVNIQSFFIQCHIADTGDAFPVDSPATHTYNVGGKLETTTKTHNGDSFVKTYTYTGSDLSRRRSHPRTAHRR
jgi:hypothetical protein